MEATADTQSKIGELLVQEGFVTEEQLKEGFDILDNALEITDRTVKR